MSVFRLQEWWSVKMGDDEEFDNGSMVVGNIDNSSEASSNKIAVGSLKGMLRVYFPTKPDFRVEDMIYEEDLGQPILTMLLGKFLPSSPNSNGLAILHPKTLVVYELIPHVSTNSHKVTHHELQKVYEHRLGDGDGKHFTAFSMVSGYFGGSRKGREMLLVQSMDGKLQIFEQSAHSFSRQFADCLIPGPMVYLPKLDAFVHCNYAARVECYRYQVLASLSHTINNSEESKESDSKMKHDARTTGFGLLAVKGNLVEWEMNVGESVRQITRGNFSNGASSSSGDETTFYAKNNNSKTRQGAVNTDEVLVLCDKSLYLLKDTGGIIQQRRLEFDASCMCAYSPTGNTHDAHTVLVASSEGTIQVYSDFVLSWAAKVNSVPVQMAVSQFGTQNGLIVTLDDVGNLMIGYLGTKPPVNAVMMANSISNGGVNNRDLNYDKIDEEHKALLQIIRDSQSDKKNDVKDKLIVRIQVPKTLDKDMNSDLLGSSNSLDDLVVVESGGDHEGYIKICVRVFISYTGDQAATNVNVVPHVPNFVHCAPVTASFDRVAGSSSTPLIIKFYMYARKGQIPTDLSGQILVTYTSSTGDARVLSYPVPIPLFLACRLRPAVKSASFKYTLGPEYSSDSSASKVGDSVVLTEAFDDMLYATQESGIDVSELLGNLANYALGFEFYYTADVDSTEFEKVDVDGIGNSHVRSSNAPVIVTSVLLSKQTGRYRVQSTSMSGLLLIIKELEQRLVTKLDLISKRDRNSHASLPVITFTDTLPLNEFYEAITNHFETRKRINSLMSDLNDKSHQFRIIQKRLLVRYKDRNPAPLNGLELLLSNTYKGVIALSDEIEGNMQLLKKQNLILTCYSKLLVSLAGMKYGLEANDRNLLEAYLCPNLNDGLDQGWEETVEASMTYLLKTCLAKTIKENVSLNNTTIEIPNSIDRLLKHIGMVFDRLGKGGRLNVVPVNDGV